MFRRFACLLLVSATVSAWAQTGTAHRFANEVVFITGGTSGIGLATAVDFAQQGAAHVIVCGRRQATWLKAQDYIKSHLSAEQAKHIHYWPCDVRLESSVKNIINKIYDRYGRLDVAFNNAGVQPGDSTVKGNIEDFDFPSQKRADGSIAYVLSSPQPASKQVHNTAWKKAMPTQATSISPYRESSIATSVFGVFYCMKWEMAAAFKRQPKNIPMAIINNASRNGIIPSPRSL